MSTAITTSNLIYCQVYDWDSPWGFGLEIAFIDHFNGQLVTALNHSAIADFHTLPVTPAHDKCVQCLH
jgi:hypothetical protein